MFGEAVASASREGTVKIATMQNTLGGLESLGSGSKTGLNSRVVASSDEQSRTQMDGTPSCRDLPSLRPSVKSSAQNEEKSEYDA